MRRCRRLSSMVLAALCACAVAGPGVASAALTATVNPNPSAVTATGTTGLTISAGTTYSCATDAFTATLASAGPAGAPLPISTNVTWRLPAAGGACTVVGGIGVRFACTATENLTVDGVTTVAGITPGSIGFDCRVSLAAAPACSVQIVGSMLQFYDNASVVTIQPGGQTLVAQNSSNGRGAACPTLPNAAAATLTAPGAVALRLGVAPATTVRVV